MRERTEEALQVFVKQGVPADLLVEVGKLARRGQLAVDEQPRDLEERRVLGDLLDRVAAVAEDAGIAVDVGDGRPGRCRVDEAVVERRESGLTREAGKI